MTCVVGLIQNDRVYIGGDSAGVAGQSLTIRSDPKVFQKGPFLIGFAHSYRMGQLLRYKLDLPLTFLEMEIYGYMVTDFVDSLRECFAEGGFGAHGETGEEFAGRLLIGYQDQLFTIDSDYQVGIPTHQFDSIGCGREFALGSLRSSKGGPIKRIELALEAASEFSIGVAPPFTILKTSKARR